MYVCAPCLWRSEKTLNDLEVELMNGCKLSRSAGNPTKVLCRSNGYLWAVYLTPICTVGELTKPFPILPPTMVSLRSRAGSHAWAFREHSVHVCRKEVN